MDYPSDGWGDRPHYGRGPATMQGAVATVLVPAFGDRDLTVELDLDGPLLTVAVNGEPPRDCAGGSCRIDVPRPALFRAVRLRPR